jgi:hypothetical protein
MLASLERAGKDLTPAPPRWEGSGRISSVTDLCYLLRRTIQACACAVNSPSPHHFCDTHGIYRRRAFDCRLSTSPLSENFYPPAPDLRHNPAAQGHHPYSYLRTGRIQ